MRSVVVVLPASTCATMPMLRMFSSMVVGPQARLPGGGTPEKKQASRRAEPNFRRDLRHRSNGQHDPGHPANTTSCPPRRGQTRESGYSGETRLNLVETCLPRRKAEERGHFRFGGVVVM